MSRSFGETSFTMRPSIVIVPSLMSSSPATMRSAVVLPQPDGPTSTMNSPSAISRSSESTARVPSGKTLPTAEKVTPATTSASHAAAEALDHVPLREEEEREHRRERDRDRGEDHVPFRDV